MKILLVSESYYPQISGVAVTVSRMAMNMVKRGHVVEVITSSMDVQRRENYQYEGVTIHVVPSLPNPFRKGFRLSVFAQNKINSVIKQFEPDVVHAHDPGAICRQAVRTAKKRNIRTVISNHFLPEMLLNYAVGPDNIKEVVVSQVYKNIIRFYNRADCIHVPTKYVKKRLEKMRVHKPIIAISNGIDRQQFAQINGEDQERQDDGKTLLSIGRLDKEKNIGFLLKVLKKVEFDYHLVIIGSGVEMEKLKRRVKKHGLSVEFLGKLPSSDPRIMEHYRKAALFLLPSKSETESLVILEAMSAGAPIVANRIGALEEVVGEEAGILLETGNVDMWARNLDALLRHPELRKQISKAGRQRSCAFDRQVVLDTWERVYLELLKGNII